ncbi:50S ribosomal protein L5 [Candidatus Tremblaya phenacola]|uniref:Large ribosomal subunit protein uL5 n=1 Tax=Candidatus Tremblayella phenacoccinincola TaxID=1010676 RepID=A0A2G0V6W1_9PROT|nr:50S ribosomal protein L5 [Candidatus Tremblaya phenacola]PHN16205.1 50S ribosomal protein L5 [Candidatus Tremblaya phenacola]
MLNPKQEAISKNMNYNYRLKIHRLGSKTAILTKLYMNTSYMQLPRLVKVVLTVGLGKARTEKIKVEKLSESLSNISGQKPVTTKASKAVANFKIKQGEPVGLKVTIRNERMFDFLDKLVNITLPRIRDFRGIPTKSFDTYGNLNIGILEQLAFPEFNYAEGSVDSGMNICIVTKTKSQESAKHLLTLFNFPFKDTVHG